MVVAPRSSRASFLNLLSSLNLSLSETLTLNHYGQDEARYKQAVCSRGVERKNSERTLCARAFVAVGRAFAHGCIVQNKNDSAGI